MHTNRCMNVMSIVKPINMIECDKLESDQLTFHTNSFQIRSGDYCLDGCESNGPVAMYTCHNRFGNQHWVYNERVRIVCYFYFDFKYMLSLLGKNIVLLAAWPMFNITGS